MKNSVINLITQISVSFFSILFIGYLSRVLTKHELGIFAILFIFEGFITAITGLGLPTSAIRLVPELEAKNEKDKVSDIIKITCFIPTLLGICLVFLGFIFRNYLSLVFLKSQDISCYIIWYLIISFFYAVFQVELLLLQSLQEFFKIGYLKMLTEIGCRLFAIIFLIQGYELKNIFLGFLIGSIIGAAAGIFSLKKFIFYKRKYSERYPIISYVKFSLPYYYQGLARFGFMYADQTIISLMFSPETLAIYFMAKKIISIPILVFSALFDPVIPKLAEIKSKSLDLFSYSLTRVYQIFSALSLFGTIMLFINSKFLLFLLGGSKFIGNYYILNILSISFFTYCIFTLLTIYIYLLKSPKEMLIISLFVGLLNIISSVILGLYLGIAGISIAQSTGFLGGIIFIYINNKLYLYKLKENFVFIALLILSFTLGVYLNEYIFDLSPNLSQWLKIFISNLFFLLGFILYLQNIKKTR